jgi:hypothetical protein
VRWLGVDIRRGDDMIMMALLGPLEREEDA